MKFFIDTANLDEIKQGVEMGMVDGVTTNPSLVAKEGRPFHDILKEICEVVEGPVNAEVVSLDAPGMLKEGRELAAMNDKIVVKIPMIVEGLKAVKQLTAEGINTNVTLVFSMAQALLAAKAGATYVSPFVGRIDDVSMEGMDLIGDIMTIYSNYGYQSEVIVASVRSPMHVMDAALIGADIATIPFKVIEQLAKHPLTDIGMEKFLSDWGETGEMIAGLFPLNRALSATTVPSFFLLFIALLVPGFIALAWQPEARADAIYVCQDDSGNKHFTNAPKSSDCQPFRRKHTFSALPKWNGPVAHEAYDQYIAQYGKRYKVDPNLIKAVIRAESDFNRHAVSRRGAQGLMQLMPDTARELNVADPFSPDQNIDGGTRYLRYLLQTFEGDLKLALAAYNAGPTLVKRLQRVPSIPETIAYVKRVLAYYQGYGKGQVVDAMYRSSIRVGGLMTIQ